ncbi:MAG: hypothetical protein ACPHXR_07520 [Flavicella sp.]
MSKKPVYIGTQLSKNKRKNIIGAYTEIDGEIFYKISNNDEMRPFFMSIVSNDNHWLFIASNGGVTAGRKDCESALFPYYTDDKITESTEVTGNKTIVQVQKDGVQFLWEPFSIRQTGNYDIERNLYKNKWGNKVIFEEINKDLQISYSYEWNSSNLYGFVKKTKLTNLAATTSEVTVLDGIQNILPSGANTSLQNERSNLVDAYKKSELETKSGIGIFSLSAIIVDRAEPSEALKANIVYSIGLKKPQYLISSKQLEAFRNGDSIQNEIDIRGEKGCYFNVSTLKIAAGKSETWTIIANINQTVSDIHAIESQLKNSPKFLEAIYKDIEKGTQDLIALTSGSDGLQLSSDTLINTRHFSNTLFNIMRGGIFDENYQIEKGDFLSYLVKANNCLPQHCYAAVEALPEKFNLKLLKSKLQNEENTDFIRLALEYMPLKFSRRHGDPSRPWNKFSINTKSEKDGSKILDYEGNWRDIFQNWEALAHSYPSFIESMIYKFLNASTFEGYNPYRVTKSGFDWEITEPDDPWSFIGYWGDHQIIYLLKFLEFSEKHFPSKLTSYFNQNSFVYANVPYKIKEYSDIVKDAKDTIEFDSNEDGNIRRRRDEIGADGALKQDIDGNIYKVNGLEKLLATVLSKLSNYIPEGGIWMNTQRPEWNDANNALVGNGVSMVTLYHLRRFLLFFEKTIQQSSFTEAEVTKELAEFFRAIAATFSENESLLNSTISNTDRKKVVDRLGIAGSNYRESIYSNGFRNEKTPIERGALLDFFSSALKHIDHSIKSNKRKDDLFHAYNLMAISEDGVSIDTLPEMLEGQVAILNSGYLSSKEAVALLKSLKKSALYREDQNSYLLYPNKILSRFVDKNTIDKSKVKNSKLLQKLLQDGNTEIVVKDILGDYHFNANFNNAESLKKAINNLPITYGKLIADDNDVVLDIFEDTFQHKYFTGRSGTFFGYEGLGSIYWHMVSKLVLGIQETYEKALSIQSEPELIAALKELYYDANEGIGVHKSPELYGAFPTDPYSHTPEGKGAQQPGMTGQVKEDILSRFGQLGIRVENGTISFQPSLLKKEEFIEDAGTFAYTNIDGEQKIVTFVNNALCFTYCQVPIVYTISDYQNISVRYKNGTTTSINGSSLEKNDSQILFERTGEIEIINVNVVM